MCIRDSIRSTFLIFIFLLAKVALLWYQDSLGQVCFLAKLQNCPVRCILKTMTDSEVSLSICTTSYGCFKIAVNQVGCTVTATFVSSFGQFSLRITASCSLTGKVDYSYQILKLAELVFCCWNIHPSADLELSIGTPTIYWKSYEGAVFLFSLSPFHLSSGPPENSISEVLNCSRDRVGVAGELIPKQKLLI